MDSGGIFTARTVPMDAALAGDVLMRLRRDTRGAVARWTLGGRGTAELDVSFFPVPAEVPSTPAWSTTARLWDRMGIALVDTVVELTGTAADTCELTLRPNVPPPPCWSNRQDELHELARAALDELAEELLWHASRLGVAAASD